MDVLITGNRGYIGCLLVKLLNEKGWNVRGFDSGLFLDCALATVPMVHTVYKDIRDAEPADDGGPGHRRGKIQAEFC